MNKLKLRTLQEDFKAEIKGVKTLIPSLITETEKVSTKTRLDIYRYAYFARIHESLVEDFPLVFQAVGKRNFSKLVKTYLEKFPSSYWTLAEVSLKFHLVMPTPALRQLATAEFQRVQSELMLLQQSRPESFALLQKSDSRHLKIQFNKTLHVYESKWNLLKLHQKNSKKKFYFVVWQIEGQGQILEVSRLEASLLSEVKSKMSLPQLLRKLESKKLKPHEIQNILSEWVKMGFVLGVL